jgi:hypothetical protein
MREEGDVWRFRKPLGHQEVQALRISRQSAHESGKVISPVHRSPLPPGDIPGTPQERSGQVRKILPPTGFDPRTVQPIAGRDTDYLIPDPEKFIMNMNNVLIMCKTLLARKKNYICGHNAKFCVDLTNLTCAESVCKQKASPSQKLYIFKSTK